MDWTGSGFRPEIVNASRFLHACCITCDQKFSLFFSLCFFFWLLPMHPGKYGVVIWKAVRRFLQNFSPSSSIIIVSLNCTVKPHSWQSFSECTKLNGQYLTVIREFCVCTWRWMCEERRKFKKCEVFVCVCLWGGGVAIPRGDRVSCRATTPFWTFLSFDTPDLNGSWGISRRSRPYAGAWLGSLCYGWSVTRYWHFTIQSACSKSISLRLVLLHPSNSFVL